MIIFYRIDRFNDKKQSLALMDLAKHTILNNSFRDAKMPGGPQVSKTSRYVITAAASPVEKRSKNKPDTSCKYCCDMRGLRNERFAKSEVQ